MDPQERYEIKRRIEQSGVCAVYEGFDKQLQRKVAIKRLLSEDESGKDYDDLMRECQSLSALASANIVSLHDVGRDEDGPFMVLELLEGESLQKIIDKGPVELEDFYQIAEQSLEGLLTAHDIHLIHRDLKPSNINVFRRPSGRLQVKLQDFGLAKFSLEPSIRTIAHSNTLFGSIYYMAPEQFERQPLDNRTDIYSLGAVYYHMLSGQYPYDGDSGAQVMIGAMNGGATHLAELRPDLDPALCDWIMSMLAKEADHRPLSCSKALEQLQNIRRGNVKSAAPAPEPTSVQDTAPSPTSVATPAQPATPPNPVPAGPNVAAVADKGYTPTVELAGAAQPVSPQAPQPQPQPQAQPAHPQQPLPQQPHPQAQPQPQQIPAAMPTQQMNAPHGYQQQPPIPNPQPTVQMMAAAPTTSSVQPNPAHGPQGQQRPQGPQGQMQRSAIPAPRITGPITGTMNASTPMGGPSLIGGGGGSRVAPLPKGSSFATKQSSPFWWLWMVGAAAAVAVVFLIVQNSPPANDASEIENGITQISDDGENPITPPENKVATTLAQELKLPSSPEQLFRKCDVNADFQLSVAEFCADKEGDEKMKLEQAFDFLDKNTDLRLVLSELYRAYRADDFFPN